MPAVAIYDPAGCAFRVIRSEMWGVEENLSLTNMDWGRLRRGERGGILRTAHVPRPVVRRAIAILSAVVVLAVAPAGGFAAGQPGGSGDASTGSGASALAPRESDAARYHALALIQTARLSFQEGAVNEGKALLSRALSIGGDAVSLEVHALDLAHPEFPLLPSPVPRAMNGVTAFSDDGSTLAFLDGAELWVWNRASDALRSYGSWPKASWLVVSPTGRYVLRTDNEGRFAVYDNRAGATLGDRTLEREPSKVGYLDLVRAAFRPDESEVAICYSLASDPVVQLLSLPAMATVASFPRPTKIGALRYAPDGRTLWLGGPGKVWKVDREQLAPAPFGTVTGDVYALDQSESGRWLAVGSDAVHMLDTKSGREIMTSADVTTHNVVLVRFVEREGYVVWASAKGEAGIVKALPLKEVVRFQAMRDAALDPAHLVLLARGKWLGLDGLRWIDGAVLGQRSLPPPIPESDVPPVGLPPAVETARAALPKQGWGTQIRRYLGSPSGRYSIWVTNLGTALIVDRQTDGVRTQDSQLTATLTGVDFLDGERFLLRAGSCNNGQCGALERVDLATLNAEAIQFDDPVDDLLVTLDRDFAFALDHAHRLWVVDLRHWGAKAQVLGAVGYERRIGLVDANTLVVDGRFEHSAFDLGRLHCATLPEPARFGLRVDDLDAVPDPAR